MEKKKGGGIRAKGKKKKNLRSSESCLGVISRTFGHLLIKLVLSSEQAAGNRVVGVESNVQKLQAWQELWNNGACNRVVLFREDWLGQLDHYVVCYVSCHVF